MLRSYLCVKDEDAEKLSVFRMRMLISCLCVRMRMLRSCLSVKDEDAEKLPVC